MSLFSFPDEVKKAPPGLRIHIDDPLAEEKLSAGFDMALKESAPDTHQPKILLCIGTDRSTGDCLGPLIGTKLAEINPPGLHIFGTLDKPVHASNLVENLEQVHTHWINPCIIAVDACLGRLDSVGFVNLAPGSLKPGAGVNKDLPPVGQLHITGIVNIGGFMEYFVLQNTRLNIVMKMANLISNGIALGLSNYQR